MVDFKGSIQGLHYQKKAFEWGAWDSSFYDLLLPKIFCLLFLIFVWIVSVLCFLAEMLSMIRRNNLGGLETHYNSNIVSPVKFSLHFNFAMQKQSLIP